MINYDFTVFGNADIIEDATFSSLENASNSAVLKIAPKVYNDDRGWFSEVLKASMPWIKQINRSSSKAGVVRGCHAQSGQFCQAKLVEALTETIFDFIIDARPDSETFGVSKMYRLDPVAQNKLFVPRGFLHAFIVPQDAKGNALFQYYCDNVFNHESEICISPKDIVPRTTRILRDWCREDADMNEEFGQLAACNEDNFIYSDKDLTGKNYDSWMTQLKTAYAIGDMKTALWYK